MSETDEVDSANPTQPILSLSPQTKTSVRISPMNALSPNRRNIIDENVYTWVMQNHANDKVVTPNLIRQKAYEIARQYDPYFKASLNWYNKWKKKYDYEESPEADALKHKKRTYTAAFKLYAVQRASQLLSVSQASLELNVPRRCLQRWKEEIDVISTVAEQASNVVYRRPGQGRKVCDSVMDSTLIEWLQQAWKDGEQVTSAAIRQKARELSTNQDFKASLGWYVKWQKRHNVDLKERTIDSQLKYNQVDSPLKLRLLPEGQETAYSERSGHSRKRKREYNDSTVQGDEEFDRLLLTWLVERWEAGVTVNEKMLRDRAAELTTNPEFHASKAWLTVWKSKYNVSLENQTYGIAGEAEGEIVEESQVYDEVTIQDNPLTPTKEEAATALASLATEDPGTTAGGLEIAQALQKLASAFGLTQGTSKDSFARQLQLTTPQIQSHSSSILSPTISETTTYLLEGGEVHVGAEEIVSEEVVTDEAVVVLESTVTTSEHVSMPSVMVSTEEIQNFTSNSVYPEARIISTISPLTAPPTKIQAVASSDSIQTSSVLIQNESISLPHLDTTTYSQPTTDTATSSEQSELIFAPGSVAQLIQDTLATHIVTQTCNSILQQHVEPITTSATGNTTQINEEIVETENSNEPVTVTVETEEVVFSEPMIEALVSDPSQTIDGHVVVMLEKQGKDFANLFLEKDDDSKNDEIEK